MKGATEVLNYINNEMMTYSPLSKYKIRVGSCLVIEPAMTAIMMQPAWARKAFRRLLGTLGKRNGGIGIETLRWR